ncbi:uncharacterized protein LOC130894953 isoform X1 [Diorhabda carinulata]|uniref:uncharacterized protein LOC130894953 isoform X1 n=1 Tax=Diorhabda carinulata TaxID=1163345 RepID=UPI0025A08F6A|nr:uncharacterized protein LOC130894953 isoform X1 [Diorhabda carinulata]XP_057658001.1 uncharacterized protein LOC130894953 isoform X1 [Diorhabda carinulata]
MVSYVNFSVLIIWTTEFFVVGVTHPTVEIPWVHPSIEVLDEINDAEILKAVQSSVSEWKRKRELKRITNRLKREDIPSACYKDVGCFEASGPFQYLDTIPDKPDDIGTKFLMYPGRRRRKRGSPPAEVPFEKLDEAFEWAKDGFNGSLPTKVLVHGFGSDCNYIWVYEIRSALMAIEEVNIICVDWSNGASLPNYLKASANTRLVGKQLALLLRGLVEKIGLSLKKTHIIGFSLGAHIAGFAGSDLGNLSRITGLDPAGPLFESQDPRARLDQSDAEFVDVIHSNGENLILGGLGTSQPMGHVDFYPNGGRMQKGCSHLFVGAVSDIIWSSPVEGRSLCNHRRAYHLFIDSVSPRCHFPAFPCDSYEDFLNGKCFPCTEERQCGNMGYYADRSKGRGQLYLITREEEPFCAHQYHVKIESSSSPVLIKSYGKLQITLVGETSLNETFTMTKKDDEEMRLGESISRILVPHPILSQPIQIELLYTAYSGWLSSGLTQWRIDKVILMDSFGKTSSVCKKNLILESGKPVLLPLYPGECNLSMNKFDIQADDRINSQGDENKILPINKKLNFVPTQVVKFGLEDSNITKSEKERISFKNAMDFFNIPWSNDKDNYILDEAESSRAFNTRLVKSGSSTENNTQKEIVEPILKTHSTKNARSHDPNKEIEITEPLLGPTTDKNSGKKSKEIEIIEKQTTTKKPVNKLSTKVDKEPDQLEEPSENPLESIANTVQFLPQRLAKMFEQAEKYARETILPLVSTYTPRFISDIIAPERSSSQIYVPLQYEEPTNKVILNSALLSTGNRNKNNEEFNPPPSTERIFSSTAEITTPVTNIQKIRKKGESEDVLGEQTKLIKSLQKQNEDEPAVEESRHTKEEISWYEQGKTTRSSEKARDDHNLQAPRSFANPLDSIIGTVQVIPENIGKMLHDAEAFAKDNVLPIVVNWTPKFIADIISPRKKRTFIPFLVEENI